MKRFLALSRTTHGVLDIAAPAFCALLWLGKFPAWPVIMLSLFAAFAAYTAIYALNDLVGVRIDREKFAGTGINQGYSVEASDMRYPLAQELLSYRSGVVWFSVWFILALIASYLLNPVIVAVLIVAALLEVTYCLLFKVTCLRTVVSGLVKASGPIAAVLVVKPDPAIPFLLLQFAWLLLWEVGGQNIPADWNDIVEDRRVNARTIPVQFGTQRAGLIVLVSLGLSVAVSFFLPIISPINPGLPYLALSLLVGFVLLLRPAFQLYRTQESRQAARLFDRASYYPLAQLLLITFFMVIPHFSLP